MIQRIHGIVTISDPDEETKKSVVDTITKLAKEFPENNVGLLGGIECDDHGEFAWFARGFYKLRSLADETVDETYLGPYVEVHVDESKLDERGKFQKPLVEKVTQVVEGILDVPAGGGKTVIGTLIIDKIKRRTLVLVPSSAIADQFRATIKHLTGIEPGFIGAGIHDIRPITVGMIQSVRSTDEILKTIGLLIVDECHHVSAPSYLSVLRACGARYRYGMTGTVKKTGDEQKIVFAALGQVLGRVEVGDLQSQGFLNKGTYRGIVTNSVGTYFDFISRRCHYYRNATKKDEPAKCPDKAFYAGGPICTFPKDGEVFDCIYKRGYHGWIYDKLAEDIVRNKLVVDSVLAEMKNHPWTIVFTHRKVHIPILAGALKKYTSQVFSVMGPPEMKMKERKLNIAEYKSSGGILVAMTQAIGEGFDAPRTSHLVRAMPAAGRVAVRQQTARTMRPQEIESLITDFVDIKIPDLKRWWFGRQSIYRLLGFKPEVKHLQKDLFGT